MTSRRTALVVVVLLLAGCLWMFLRPGAGMPIAPVGGVGDGGRAAALGSTGDEEAASAERAAVDDPAPPPTAVAGEDTPDAFTVRGRCVSAAEGQALVDCVVQARVEKGRDARSAAWSASEFAATATTGPDGAFELQVGFDAWTDTVAVRVGKEGFTPRTGRWPRPEPGSAVDVGDVSMVGAITVSGAVRDQQGAPVADVSVMLVDVALSTQHALAMQNDLRARTDAAGQFAFESVAHPGEWFIGAQDTGALVAPRSVNLTAEQRTFDLQITVERPDPRFSITGTVVDAAGQPVPGMGLSAFGEGFMGRGRSGPDGRFAVQRAGPMRDDGKPGARLSCSDPKGVYERLQPAADARFAWGEGGVEVVMRRRVSRTVRVTDTRGRVVTDYTLFVFRGKERLRRYGRLTSRGVHPGGRCRIAALESGHNALVVVPRSLGLAATEVIPFVVDPEVADGEVPVTVRDAVSVEVAVTAGAGRVMAGSRVELLQSLAGKPPGLADAVQPLLDLDRYPRTPAHVVVATGSTGDDGVARLSAPPGAWFLRVTGTEHVAVVQPAAVTPPATRLSVAVQVAAVLEGEVSPSSALHTLQELARVDDKKIEVVATPTDGEALPAAAVGADGSYVLGGLAPGEYAVALRYWLRTGEVHSDTVTMPVATVVVAGGERRTLGIDASSMLPATAEGRVVFGGEPLREVHCFLRRKGERLRGLRVATDDQGRYRGLVPPGEYGFAITYPAQPGPGWLHMVLPGQWMLTSGQTRRLDFDVPLREVRLRVLDAAGAPLANQRVKVVRKGYSVPGALNTDAEGVVEVRPAPVEAFEVEVQLEGEKHRLGPVDLPPGETRGEVTVRVGG